MEGCQEIENVQKEWLSGSYHNKRKSLGAQEDPSRSKKISPVGEKDFSILDSACDGSLSGIDVDGKLKKKKEEVEDIHAASQRLLRETKGVAFIPELLKPKPATSLIEKIRQRKLQLMRSSSKTSSSLEESSNSMGPTVVLKTTACPESVELNLEDDVVVYKCSSQPATLIKLPSRELSASDSAGAEPAKIALLVDGVEKAKGCGNMPTTPVTQNVPHDCITRCESPPRNLRAPFESEDLYADSQSSRFLEATADEENVHPGSDYRINIHIDSDTYDSSGSKESEDLNVQGMSRKVSYVDDEAEDDSSGEDEDEDDDAAEELRDLLSQDSAEKPEHIVRRSELHNKYLEEQDLAMEDAILQKIQNGWKSKTRTPAFHCNDREVLLGRNGLERLHEENDVTVEPSSDYVFDDQGRDVAFSGVTVLDEERFVHGCPVEDESFHFHESSDDEEANVHTRSHILEESDEQMQFLSVTEDESSREIFGLINKVNVTTTKSRPATVHGEVRIGTVDHHPSLMLHHQLSFVRNKVAMSVTTNRQGSGNFRSYIFCQDESNSKDSFQSVDKIEQIGRDNFVMTSSAKQRPSSASKQFQKCSSSLVKEGEQGRPSLFQVLKQQAAELATRKDTLLLDGNVSKTDDLSIFSKIRQSRLQKGQQR